MPNYRRNFLPGETDFFTLVKQNRTPLFRTELASTILGTAIRGGPAGASPFRDDDNMNDARG